MNDSMVFETQQEALVERIRRVADNRLNVYQIGEQFVLAISEHKAKLAICEAMGVRRLSNAEQTGFAFEFLLKHAKGAE